MVRLRNFRLAGEVMRFDTGLPLNLGAYSYTVTWTRSRLHGQVAEARLTLLNL